MVPRIRYILAAALAALAAFAAVASASPLDVHRDYFDNGVIDQPHSTQDLRDALEAARGDAQYADLAEAVDDALDQALLGRSPQAEDEQATGGAPATSDSGLGVLPSPRNPDESGTPPWPLLVLTALAGMLAISGAGSSIYRRFHRQH